MSNNYDEDAILGAKIERLVVSILQKHVDGGLVSAAAMNDLKARLSALEEASSNENIGERTADAFDSQSLKVGGVDVTDATDHTVTFSQASSKSDITSGSTLSNLFGKIKKWYNSFGSLAWKSSVSDADISGTISDSHIASASAWNVKAEQVNVTNYTSFSDIGDVISAGNIPYYYHAVGSGAAKLYYQGTNVSGGIPPTVSQVFVGVFNGVLYETRFVNGASAFSAVVETPIFSDERVASSGESSSWSSDDTNVPTRAAVESKISSAMSGNIGGFLGSWTPIGVQYYQTANDFKKGDWVSITEAGSVAYYKNNDRSQSYTTFAVNAGDDIYWTTSGEFQKKASTSLQIYPISNLEDWNSLTNTGLYQIASQASNVQNSPSTGNCVCYVCEVNSAVVQFVISPNHIYKRYRGGSGSGQWGSWTAVDNIEIIVGSTSFNDLKALYGMTKNLVAVGSETVSSNNYTTLFALASVKLSGSTPTEFIFERSCPHSAGQVGQVEQKICTSSGWSSALLNVKYSETSGTATNYNENVGSIKTALDSKIGRTPVGISSGSGVTNGAFFSAVLLIVLPSISDYPYNLGGNGMYISLKSFIEWAVGNTYKMQKGQIYMILNNRGGTVRLYKGTSTDSEYVSLDNDRIAFLGCWGLTVGTEYFLQGG